MCFLRGLFAFVVLTTLATSLAACGDDDYGQKLDLGQDLSVIQDLSGQDLSGIQDLSVVPDLTSVD